MTPEQLKASILQRAMEGKLVPQDPNDEPASELLKRIKAEKEKLIKEGKIKRDKNETEIFRGDDGLHYEKFQDGSIKQVDVPFEIPESWGWVRFNNIATILRGASPRPIKDFLTDSIDGINWIKIGDTEKSGKYITDTKEKIKKSGLSKTRLVKKGSFLLTNSMSFGRPYILKIDGAIHDGWLSISDFESSITEDFLYYFLLSRVAYSQFLLLISGAVVKNLNSEKVASIFIPIPPLNEQARITQKIEIALSRLDDYHALFNTLRQLNNSFPEKLRKSILQYAMQGKLVPQDAMDEPVEVLLEKIREEKQKLFAEGKLKKKDLQESIIYQGDDNSYYEKRNKELLQLEKIPSIPLTWKYLRFNQIVNYYMGQTPPRSISTYWGSDIPWVSIADMVNDGIIYSTKEALSNTFKSNIQEKISPPNTLLMSFKLTVGKVSLLGIEAAHNEAIISIFPYADPNEIMKMYLFKFLPEIVKYGDSKDAIKGKTLNSKSINALLIPLPPLDEQKRIVDKIEKLDLSVEKLNCIQNKN